MIEPRTLKGFRDYLPAAMLLRERLIDTARAVYRSYGFAPIDTPALEYLEILAGKGGEESDKQLYSFTDRGGRQVGLRFDLTVPLARFAAQHVATLGTPFKRYHIAPVWRGENTQRGRYREFMQCDFDTIGTESIAADIETTLVIADLFRALGIDAFTIHVNNRRVLNGLLENLGLRERSAAVLRALDKLAKIGRDKVAEELVAAAGATAAQADEVLKLAAIADSYDPAQPAESNAATIAQLAELVKGSATGSEGVQQLDTLRGACAAVWQGESCLKLDVSIARGLDYYTGTVFETFLGALPGIGSVCSGGRYDNLAELYTKQRLPGIGASLGLDRLLAALEELGAAAKATSPADVFIPYFEASRLADYQRLAAGLRMAGGIGNGPSAPGARLNVEVYPEPKRLGDQLKYADARGIRLAVIVGETEWQAGRCQVKHLAQRETRELDTLDPEKIAAAIRAML
ncbi:MAG: histidine--tRNA ligase [Pirellulales bacterium]|nr:histidine--tRNA ligase [Pirellulales bacterium]